MVVICRSTVVVVLVLLAFLTPDLAHALSPVSAADEVVEVVVKKWGRSGAAKLSRLGGKREIVRILTKAEQQGGDRLTKRVVYYGTTRGVDALTIIRRSPKAVVGALDKIPPGKFRQAFNAVEHAPKRCTKLLQNLGPDALGPMIKHPGIGVDLLEKLGDHGIWVSRRISTKETRLLLRHADDIAKLSRSRQKEVIQAIGKYPAKALDYLEKHPRILLTTAGTGTFLALFGRSRPMDGADPGGPKTTMEWFLQRILKTFRTEIGMVFLAVALGICGWSAVRIWKAWRN